MTVAQITHANATHIEGIAALEEKCFSLPWLAATYKRELVKSNAITLVAFANDTVVGLLNAHFVLDECSLNRIAVSPEHRRNGIADRLIDALVGACRVRGAQFILLDVRRSNEAAQRLYAKHGFTEVGKRPKYYQQPDEEAVLLTKNLAV